MTSSSDVRKIISKVDEYISQKELEELKLEEFEYCGNCVICSDPVQIDDAGHCGACGQPFHWGTCGDWGIGQKCNECLDDEEEIEFDEEEWEGEEE